MPNYQQKLTIQYSKTNSVRLKNNLKKRFFTSFHYAQNDNKLGWRGQLRGVVLRRSLITTPLNCESIQEPVIPMRSEESHKFYRTRMILKHKAASSILNEFSVFLMTFTLNEKG